MLNRIVWNRTDYLYKNRFGIKYPTKVDMLWKPTNQSGSFKNVTDKLLIYKYI